MDTTVVEGGLGSELRGEMVAWAVSELRGMASRMLGVDSRARVRASPRLGEVGRGMIPTWLRQALRSMAAVTTGIEAMKIYDFMKRFIFALRGCRTCLRCWLVGIDRIVRNYKKI